MEKELSAKEYSRRLKTNVHPLIVTAKNEIEEICKRTRKALKDVKDRRDLLELLIALQCSINGVMYSFLSKEHDVFERLNKKVKGCPKEDSMEETILKNCDTI